MNLSADNKSLFYAINTTNVILAKCLRVGIAALRECMRKMNLCFIGLNVVNNWQMH